MATSPRQSTMFPAPAPKAGKAPTKAKTASEAPSKARASSKAQPKAKASSKATPATKAPTRRPSAPRTMAKVQTAGMERKPRVVPLKLSHAASVVPGSLTERWSSGRGEKRWNGAIWWCPSTGLRLAIQQGSTGPILAGTPARSGAGDAPARLNAAPPTQDGVKVESWGRVVDWLRGDARPEAPSPVTSKGRWVGRLTFADPSAPASWRIELRRSLGPVRILVASDGETWRVVATHKSTWWTPELEAEAQSRATLLDALKLGMSTAHGLAGRACASAITDRRKPARGRKGAP